MSDTILNELKEVIGRQLPAQVGETLRKRLDQAEMDARELAISREGAVKLSATNAELRAELAKHGEITTKIAALAKVDADVTSKLLRQEMNDLKVAQAELRVMDMKHVVGLVFANNRFKYQEYGSEPVVRTNGDYQTIESGASTRTVEGES